jgi:eukaryotic-like serine/threonine-protein kinase
MTPERWHQVTNMFHAARGVAPESRRAFLAQGCGEDTMLRREVEAMLAAHDSAGPFGETPLFASVPVTRSQSAAFGDMALSAGTRLGPYHILSALGAGGMGEVYRAHDSRLSRDVAIKTLPSTFADNPERLERFGREARVLASLNHPNIAAIYGLEKSGELNHLVMELVEGTILSGPVPLDKALDYARQVAEALEAAHAKGIIHRDIKPANVKVTPEGRVKVLDFGLAKAVLAIEDTAGFSQLDTSTGLRTLAGHIVGSPSYMSPEQARGDEVDERTDIWAFGCLLYELLTGKRAFPGEAASDTIAAVLKCEPNLKALPGATPSTVRQLLRRCLTKDRSRRLHHISDARRTLEHAQRRSARWQVAAIAAAALAALAIAASIVFRGSTGGSNLSQWIQITKLPDSVSQPALSPDGSKVAFVRGTETFFGPGQVYVKTLPAGEPLQLTNDNLMKMSPMFSPDGAQIAYTTVDEKFGWYTWLVPAAGGEPKRWLANASGLIWSDPGTLLFSEMDLEKIPHMGIVRTDDKRVGKRDVYWPGHDDGMAHRSYPSPDGKWVLLVEMDEHHVWMPCRLVPIDGSSSGRQVGPAGGACTFAAWSPDGRWMYLNSDVGGVNHIWRQRFPDGAAEQITFGPTAEQGIAVAADGRSFVSAVAMQDISIWLHDASGERQISPLEAVAVTPKFTADGKKLCYRIVKQTPTTFAQRSGEIWITDLESGRSAPLAPGFEAFDYDVSADGQKVVLDAEDSEHRRRLWIVPLDRRSPPVPIPSVEGRQARFGPTGEVFFRRTVNNSNFAFRVYPDGSGLRKAVEEPILILRGVSPDGQWIVGWAPLPGGAGAAYQAFSLGGLPSVSIVNNIDWSWSPSGDTFSISGGPIAAGRSYVVPLQPGRALPPVPERGFVSEQDVAGLPGARRIDALSVVPGPSPNVYAFYRGTTQRNLYRIPVQ